MALRLDKMLTNLPRVHPPSKPLVLTDILTDILTTSATHFRLFFLSLPLVTLLIYNISDTSAHFRTPSTQANERAFLTLAIHILPDIELYVHLRYFVLF